MEALRGMLLGVQASFEAERASLGIRIDELERQILDQNMLIADPGRTSAEHNKLSADQAAEIKELRREIQELRRELGRIYGTFMVRQLALDLEFQIMKTVTEQHLGGHYEERSLREMKMKHLIDDCREEAQRIRSGSDFCGVCRKRGSPTEDGAGPKHAAVLTALDDIASRAGYSVGKRPCRAGTLALCLSRAISRLKQQVNALAHDDARAQLRRLSAADRAALIPDDNRLTLLYEFYCGKTQ